MRISDWSSDVCSSDLGNGDASLLGGAPSSGDLVAQGFGWVSGHESGGIGEHAVTSGLEGAWVNTPTEWSENYFRLLLDYEYELVRSPAGAQQWQPVNQRQEDMAPAAWDSSKRSEEHTSELPSLMRISYAVFCLQKKKTQKNKSKS